jgi:hypothetical protein
MFGLLRKPAAPPEPEAPVLDLSGDRLRRAFEDLVSSAEATGGVERYVTALALKASLFEEILGRGKLDELSETELLDLAAFISPVRRRIGAHIAAHGFLPLAARIAALLDGWADTSTTDARMAAFMQGFPADRDHRWLRDLAAEILHYTAPDRYPLMARWVWDARVGTGVLREIWFADDVDAVKIRADDSYRTFVTLSGELEGFLKANGVFRDLPFYTDLLMGHIYAGYINDRGGQYLRQDFAHEGDPMIHTRRMLGLDAVDTETGRTRLKLIDGSAHVLGAAKALPYEEAD